MSVLTICQGAARRLKFSSVPTAVVSATDEETALLYELLQSAVDDVVRGHEWQALTSEHTWSATATEAQANAFPSDFGRMCQETFWNRDEQRQVYGPLTVQEWQELKATVTNAVFDQYTVRGGAMLLDPVPTAGDTYAYSYITNTPWLNGSTPAETPADDAYTTVLNDELLTRELIWRHRKSSGLDYADEQAASLGYAMQLMAQEQGGSRTLRLGGGSRRRLERAALGVQEGNWPLS